jgi:carbamate kinase
MQRAVVVLGGNAFAGRGGRLSMAGQMQFAYEALCQLKPLLADSTEMLISHGNGPQVGHILIRVEEALGKAYSIPLEVCVAESEGELGYVLQQSLHNVLSAAGASRPIATLLTQVVVDEHDEAFEHPTKPIGPFYDDRQAKQLRDKGFTVIDDAGRGFRRVVPSPTPREVVEIDVIRKLLDMGVITIAAGGGGISVVRRNGQLHGVEAVIDKDLTAALIADQLDAQLLIILTGVQCAYRNFGTTRQEAIGRVDARQARQLLDEGHFAPGSMRPKIEAAIQFASQPQRQVIICDPPSLAAAFAGAAGTIVEFE